MVDDRHGHRFAALGEAEARARLDDLMALRAALLEAPGPLLCECSAAFATGAGEAGDVDAGLEQARKRWYPNDHVAGRREGERAEVLRLWPRFPGDDGALRDAFVTLSLRVWGPLFAGIEPLDAKGLRAFAEELEETRS